MERPTAAGLFTRHHLSLFRFLRRMTGDPVLAEDLTQDVFVRVVRGLESYDPRERDLAWLFRIARRLLLDRARMAARSLRIVRDDDVPPRFGGSDPLEAATLDQALQRLPDADREAFLLREVSGLGYAEIAAIAGISPDAVRNRIYRARRALREALSPSFEKPRGAAANEASP